MKKKGYFTRKTTFSILLILLGIFSQAQAASITDVSSTLGDLFEAMSDPNEATTSFRSLLIPFGGRTESL